MTDTSIIEEMNYGLSIVKVDINEETGTATMQELIRNALYKEEPTDEDRKQLIKKTEEEIEFSLEDRDDIKVIDLSPEAVSLLKEAVTKEIEEGKLECSKEE